MAIAVDVQRIDEALYGLTGLLAYDPTVFQQVLPGRNLWRANTRFRAGEPRFRVWYTFRREAGESIVELLSIELIGEDY